MADPKAEVVEASGAVVAEKEAVEAVAVSEDAEEVAEEESTGVAAVESTEVAAAESTGAAAAESSAAAVEAAAAEGAWVAPGILK